MKYFRPILAVALVSALTFVNAHAIGKREKGALMGAGILLMLPTLSQNMNNLFGAHTGPVVTHQAPLVHREVVYVEKAPPPRRHYYEKRHKHYSYEPYTRKTIIIER